MARVGRYALLGELGQGGMGSVLLGRASGAAGFSRFVAIKRVHPHYAQDPGFVSRFKDEVRVSSSVQHPNVVETLDVLSEGGELLLVMEYVHGATLHALLEDATRQARRLPLDVVSAVVAGCLHGIHAAHEARDEQGVALQIVHRDISPQNVIVGRDGQIKVLDFGLAQALAQSHVSQVGLASGKAGYMAPEQVRCEPLDRRADIFAVGVVLWEALTGQRLFRPSPANEAMAMQNVLSKPIPAPSDLRADVPSTLDEVALRALNRNPKLRFATAKEFALALELALTPATASRVGSCLSELCGTRLEARAELLASVRHGPVMAADTVVNRVERTEPQTQVALPAVAAEAPGPAPRGWAQRAKTIVLIAAALTPVLGWMLVSASKSQRHEVAPPAVRTHVSAATGAATVNPVPTPSTAETSSARVEVEPTRGPVAATRPATRSMPINRAAATKINRHIDRCSPPTFVDADGIRHFKEGCL